MGLCQVKTTSCGLRCSHFHWTGVRLCGVKVLVIRVICNREWFAQQSQYGLCFIYNSNLHVVQLTDQIASASYLLVAGFLLPSPTKRLGPPCLFCWPHWFSFLQKPLMISSQLVRAQMQHLNSRHLLLQVGRRRYCLSEVAFWNACL